MGDANRVRQAEEDLAVIRRLMEGARENVSNNGWHLILWGGLLAMAGGIGQWADSRGLSVPLGLVWAVAVGMGWGISIPLRRRTSKQAAVDSLVNRILAAIWVGCGLGLTLLGFCGIWTGTLPEPAVPGVMAIVIGTAFFASSSFCSPGLFRGLAIVWWALGSVMLIWPGPANGLLICVSLVLFMAVPGLLLSRRVRPATRMEVIT